MNNQLPMLSIEDYQYLKLVMSKEQNYCLDRDSICMLQRKLEQAQVVEPEDIPHDVVTINSRVHLHDLNVDDVVICTLVYPSDAVSSNSTLSVLAPWGLAIIGCRVGELIEWPYRTGYVRIRIVNITYHPKAKLRPPVLLD